MDKKPFVLLVVVSILSGLVGGAVSPWIFTKEVVFAQNDLKHEKVITAETFRLVDQDGNLRAKLGMEPGGRWGLVLIDKDNKARVGITLSEKGWSGFDIKDKEGDRRISIGTDGLWRPFMTLLDKGDKPRASLNLFSNKVSLDLMDQDGRARTAYSVLANGASNLSLWDKNAEIHIGLGVSSDGVPRMTVH